MELSMLRMFFVALAGGLVAITGAAAKPFDAQLLTDQPIVIGDISVSLDEDLVGRQSSSFPRSGERLVHPADAESLTAALTEDLTNAFSREGLLSSDAQTTLVVEITAVRPSNPGFTRNGASAGVSASGSLARGGAALEGRITDADGAVLATFSYERYEQRLDAFSPRGAWSRANTTFRTFADRSADAIVGANG